MAIDFAERYGPWAVVAGASEGVGSAAARLLSERGVNVVLVSRRQQLLDEVAATVASETRTVALDLSRPGATESLIDATADLDVGLYIYNAGADDNASEFLEKPAVVWQELVFRNCVTVLGTAHHYAGRMVARGRGGIILVTSGAGWAGGSHIAVYGASKAFDLVLGEALWAELGRHGVDVLSMVLGTTDTPLLRRVLNGREIAGIVSAEEVARTMLDRLPEGPTYPPGPPALGALTRRDAVERVSQGSTALLGVTPWTRF